MTGRETLPGKGRESGGGWVGLDGDPGGEIGTPVLSPSTVTTQTKSGPGPGPRGVYISGP